MPRNSHNISLADLQTFFILPIYLVSAGGVLFIDGQYIYQYYKVCTGDDVMVMSLG